MKFGFDNELYTKRQTEEILRRIEETGSRLYLEFGGKLFDDCHASRVLPGFDVNAKVKILQKLKDKAEIIIAINARDLEKNKIRADYGINYGSDVLRLIDNLRALDIYINSVVITQYEGQAQADIYKKKLERRGEKVYIHTKTKGYPTDIDTIISDEGYGKNPYIPTTRPLVVVTAPGPGSGKLATCLCQLYHEYKLGNKVGYAKFETFPIWNIPLKHPVNVAYEAATADLKDVNMIDHFHLEAYGSMSVNYNRDIEVFPVVKAILSKIMNKEPYKSPTDMGVNMAGYAIVDDNAVQDAAKQEVLRRYYKACCDYKQGLGDIGAKEKIELLMSDLGITIVDRKVVQASLDKSYAVGGVPVIAVELHNGKIVTGKQTEILSAAASVVLNAVKTLAKIDDEIDLISPIVLEPILQLKKDSLHEHKRVLSLREVLIALSICAATSPVAKLAISKLKLLDRCEAHSTVMLSKDDESVLKKLNVYISTEAEFESNNLFSE